MAVADFDGSVARALVARSGRSEAGDKPPRYEEHVNRPAP